MKKFLSFLLLFLMFTTISYADNPTLSELVILYQDALDLEARAIQAKQSILNMIYAAGYPSVAEMLKADATKTLKPGIYQVGKDIEIGTYRFMYEIDGGWFSRVRIGSEVNARKTDLEYDRQKFDLYDPFGMSYFFQTTEAYYRLKDGDYVIIELGDVRLERMEQDLTW